MPEQRPGNRGLVAVRTALKITALNFRARLEYRSEFLMMVAIGALWQVSVLVFAGVLLTRFPGLGGWPSGAVLLIAGTRLLSHGLFVLFLGRVSSLTALVQRGSVDAYLLRPIPVYRQVQLSSFNVNAIGDLIVAGALFGYALSRVHLAWTAARGGYLLAAVVGGMFMEAAIMTAMSCAALHAPAAAYWTTWLEDLLATFGNYRLHILPRLARDTLVFALPIAFVSYFPVAVVTGNRAELGVPHLLAAAAPVVGVLSFLGSRLLWSMSLSRYKGVSTV